MEPAPGTLGKVRLEVIVAQSGAELRIRLTKNSVAMAQ
jgi:hypothetical protein